MGGKEIKTNKIAITLMMCFIFMFTVLGQVNIFASSSSDAGKNYGRLRPSSYSSRNGVIIVTPDSFYGLPIGHASIIWDGRNNVIIEATSSGVVKGANNWYTTKKIGLSNNSKRHFISSR